MKNITVVKRSGQREPLALEKWQTQEMVPVAAAEEKPTVPLLLPVAERLAGLATKIKLALTW